MQDQHLPPQLDERRIRQGRGDLFQAGLEESNQVIVTGVANPDDQQVGWNATCEMRVPEVRIFADDDPALSISGQSDGSVGGLVPVRKQQTCTAS